MEQMNVKSANTNSRMNELKLESSSHALQSLACTRQCVRFAKNNTCICFTNISIGEIW